MAVDTKHPDYARMAPVWQKCREVAQGQRAVHAAGVRYLPKLYQETDTDYEARRDRALFFNATWRTIAGLRGMLFRKEPGVDVSTAAEGMLADVSCCGVDFCTFAKTVAEEALTVGRVGILTDYPRANVAGLTVAAAEALNLRPNLAMYKAESIVNWRTEWINNRCVLTLVVLEEQREIVQADGFTTKCETVYRVLDLFAPTPGAPRVYRVAVWRKSGGQRQRDLLVEEPFFPMQGGQYMAEIPFVFIGVERCSPDIEEPPLIDLVDVNVSHYQTTADLEHGAHQTALPQPWLSGVDPTRNAQGQVVDAFYIGGGQAWVFPRPEAKAGMLEYTGQGLGALEKRLEVKEKQMAVLGARMLEQQQRQIETAEAAGIHRAGEQATLADQADTLSAGLTRALAAFDRWAGGSGDVTVAVNKDFLPRSMSAQELTAVVAAWQQGALTSEELFDELQDGGVIDESVSYADHSAALSAEPPRFANGLALPAPAGGTGGAA